MSYPSDVSVWVASCALCNNPVELETCNTDESGRMVHEECYVVKIRSTQALPAFVGVHSGLAYLMVKCFELDVLSHCSGGLACSGTLT
jgi:hypothetical protein